MSSKNTKRLSAKDFFSGLNEEKPDATRVDKKHHEGMVVNEKAVRDWNNEHPAAQEERRVERADAYGSTNSDGYIDGSPTDYSKATQSYNEKFDNQRGFKYGVYGEKPQKEIKSGDDMKVYSKEIEQNREKSLEKAHEIQRAKSERDANNKKKAETFEKNLTKFDKMDSKKNPGGWAKEFFKDLHDK